MGTGARQAEGDGGLSVDGGEAAELHHHRNRQRGGVRIAAGERGRRLVRRPSGQPGAVDREGERLEVGRPDGAERGGDLQPRCRHQGKVTSSIQDCSPGWTTSPSLVAAPWLQITPTFGAVGPAYFQTLTFTINSAGLPEGLHQTTATLTSSDPDTPSLSIPVQLQFGGLTAVDGQTPVAFGLTGAIPNPF